MNFKQLTGSKVFISQGLASITAHWLPVHPQLRFILHVNCTVEGEQLLSQLLRAIPDKQWLFRYGRVPMNVILSSRMWEVNHSIFDADSFVYRSFSESEDHPLRRHAAKCL